MSCPTWSGRSVAWLARLNGVQKVESSNLSAPTILLSFFGSFLYWLSNTYKDFLYFSQKIRLVSLCVKKWVFMSKIRNKFRNKIRNTFYLPGARYASHAKTKTAFRHCFVLFVRRVTLWITAPPKREISTKKGPKPFPLSPLFNQSHTQNTPFSPSKSPQFPPYSRKFCPYTPPLDGEILTFCILFSLKRNSTCSILEQVWDLYEITLLSN